MAKCKHCSLLSHDQITGKAHLSEVAGVVLVEVDAVVVLPAGVAAAARVLAVLADAAVTVRHVAAQLPRLLLVRRHGPDEIFEVLVKVFTTNICIYLLNRQIFKGL